MNSVISKMAVPIINGAGLGVTVPAQVKSAIMEDSSVGAATEATAGAIKIVKTFVELAGRNLPLLGEAVDVVLIAKHVNDAFKEWEKKDGSLSNATLAQLGNDCLGVITAGGLVAATITGSTVAVPILAAGAIASTALAAAGLFQSSEDTSAFDYWADFAGSISDSIGDARDAVGDFFEEVAQEVSAGIEAVAGQMERTGDALGDFVKGLGDDIRDGISDLFDAAQSAVQRRDPLTLDLDGDGLETIGIDPANPILFDHDGDGIKTATGWIKPDDAFLVLDRNGNGTIDDGTELFGDSTPLMDSEGNVAGAAEDGFAALAREDTNGDGVVDSNDANFADLRVWRDLNSDGVSQAEELQSLDEAGIAAINVAKTENSRPLPDGNLLADLGSFVRIDGSQGGVGAVSAEMGDIDLIEDTFHSEFADSIPLTPEAEALPNMSGSGRVRSLQEAASLSPELTGLLSQYAQATTRAGQLALLDQLIVEWGKTSDLGVTCDGAYDGVETNVSIAGYSEGSAGYEAWMTKLQTLERFNGRAFGTTAEGGESVSVNLFNARLNFLNQAYDALKQSVYDGLLLQTRLKPYMDALELTIDQNGLGMDFTGTDTIFQDRFDAAPAEAVRDLLDLQRIAGTNLNDMGWDGYGQLRGWLGEVAGNIDDPTLMPAIVAALGDFGYPGLQTQGDGTNGSEAMIGDDAGDVLNGQGGNDLVLGSDGDDTLNGGIGNDVLYGGSGNDIYVFNAGDGTDTIVESHGDTGMNSLAFGPGILAGDLDIYAEGDKLVFAHTNGRDRVSIANWFGSLADDTHRLDTLNFADSKTLDLNTLQLGGDEADSLDGTEANETYTDKKNGQDWKVYAVSSNTDSETGFYDVGLRKQDIKEVA